MTAREAFMQRVKQAVAEGNRAGAIPPLPQRAAVGYQGAGADPVQRFSQELAAAGGKCYLAADEAEALRTILTILHTLNARKISPSEPEALAKDALSFANASGSEMTILLSRGGLVDQMRLPTKLREWGLDAKTLDDLPTNGREFFFAADVGITNVHRLIAETGSVVLAAKPDEPRSASLLPPVHICLANRSQLLPDLFDLFDLFAPLDGALPSCVTLVTGPSKTGDIELKLVTGVHGPGEVHVVLCDGLPTV